ncbi:MAG: hypothetical protein IIA92_12630 [Chloroflexi bacterium]|nr:hypothetical protein [Chloroflexota bacterium]
MAALSADRFPGAEHQPLSYPGSRPDFPFVYYQGQVYEIRPEGNAYDDLRVQDSAGEVALDAFLKERGNAPMSQRRAVLAVGSNGCPGRLAEKYDDQPEVAVPVLVGTMQDTAVVYSNRLVFYAALPASYLYQPGAVSWLSVTMLTDEQLSRMDETENVGESYLRIAVPGELQVDGGPSIGNLTAYLDRSILTYHGQPVLVKTFARQAPDWPAMDQRELLTQALDLAGILRDEPLETRHRHLLENPRLRSQFIEYLETQMSELQVDVQGSLIPR